MAQQFPLETPAPPTQLPLGDIQGDVVIGLHKSCEAFLFIHIDDVGAFKAALKKDIAPLITSTADVNAAQKQIDDARKQAGSNKVILPIVGTNIAFSAKGLNKLGLAEAEHPVSAAFKRAPVKNPPVGDAFQQGQVKDAVTNLSDPVNDAGLTTWKRDFLAGGIHAILLVTAPSFELAAERIIRLKTALGKSAHILATYEGQVRPGLESGHEHFGFKDGVSNPRVVGVNDRVNPDHQQIIKPELILLGYKSALPSEQSWAKNGSFLVFRQLQQLVPEFHKQGRDLAIGLQTSIPGITSQFLEARMVGRWPSGAPLTLQDDIRHDDPILGGDSTRNNDFDYRNGKGADLDQIKCPFKSHIRVTNPRAGGDKDILDREKAITPHLMIRQGIPYGPEVTLDEHLRGTSSEVHERGLLFVSYQADIEEGFQFVQKNWSNLTIFPVGTKPPLTPGVDPIIGQTGDQTEVVQTQGIANPPKGNTDNANQIKTVQHVIPRGGEYFFTPPISALTGRLSQASIA